MSSEWPLQHLFAALSERTRLRILSVVADREICVCFLVEALGLAQPTISRHLSYLRESGVLEARRDGKWMHYRLAKLPKAHLAIIEEALSAIRHDADVKADRKRLSKACCSPQLVGIADAPVPRIV